MTKLKSRDENVRNALKLLEEGKTTVSKAAEIAGIDIWSFIEKLKNSKIVWVKDDVVKKYLKHFR